MLIQSSGVQRHIPMNCVSLQIFCWGNWLYLYWKKTGCKMIVYALITNGQCNKIFCHNFKNFDIVMVTTQLHNQVYLATADNSCLVCEDIFNFIFCFCCLKLVFTCKFLILKKIIIQNQNFVHIFLSQINLELQFLFNF